MAKKHFKKGTYKAKQNLVTQPIEIDLNDNTTH